MEGDSGKSKPLAVTASCRPVVCGLHARHAIFTLLDQKQTRLKRAARLSLLAVHPSVWLSAMPYTSLAPLRRRVRAAPFIVAPDVITSSKTSTDLPAKLAPSVIVNAPLIAAWRSALLSPRSSISVLTRSNPGNRKGTAR